jgi:hypothetical protein
MVNIAPWRARGSPAGPPRTIDSPDRKFRVNSVTRPALFGLTVSLLISCSGGADAPAPWQPEDAFGHLARTPVTEADYAGLEVTVLAGETLSDDERIGAVGGMVVDGDVLWLLSEITDPWLYLVDRRDGNYLGTAGRQGEGPGEFGLLSSISSDGTGGIWGNDLSTNRLTHLRSESPAEPVRIVSLPADFTSTFRAVRVGNRFIGWAMRPQDNIRVIGDSGEAIATTTLVPGPDSIGAIPRVFQAANNRLCSALDGSRAVIAYFDIGRADIVDRDGKFIAQVEVPFPRPGAFTRGAEGGHDPERVVMHYQGCTTSRDHIYLLHSGARFTWPSGPGDAVVNDRARTIHVFDWTGKPAGIYRLDRVVTAIAVDSEGRELYAADFETGGVVRFRLP